MLKIDSKMISSKYYSMKKEGILANIWNRPDIGYFSQTWYF